MSRAASVACLLAVACWAACAALATDPQPAPPKHLQWAELLVKDVRPEHNDYTYTDNFIRFQGEDGATQSECHCDCSGLLTLLFCRAYGWTAEDMRKWVGRSMPVARVYYDAIEQGNRFAPVLTVGEIRPGDVIAVKFRIPNPETKDTGHVMIVAEAPVRREASEPLVPDTQQ